jgi:hypothetical protein
MEFRLKTNFETLWTSQERSKSKGKEEARFEKSQKSSYMVKEVIVLLLYQKTSFSRGAFFPFYVSF